MSFKPVLLFENEIKRKEELKDARLTLDHLSDLDYKWIVISRKCGTLIYAGVIGRAVQDIFNFHFLMQAQGRKYDFPYSDILVFTKVKRIIFVVFQMTLEVFRRPS